MYHKHKPSLSSSPNSVLKSHAFVSLPLQSSSYNKPCINKSYRLVKFRTSNLKSLVITRGIAGLTTTTTATTAGTVAIVRLLSFFGLSTVFYYLFSCNVVPAGEDLTGMPIDYAHITPEVNSSELISMLHNQIGVINELTARRAGPYADYHFRLNTILNHLRANLQYVTTHHYAIVPQYNELITYLSVEVSRMAQDLIAGRVNPNDATWFFTNEPTPVLDNLGNKIENIISVLDPTYEAV